MARGESEASRSPGAAVAIWSVFAVACLLVAWVVVRVSGEPDEPEDPFGTGEPHPGIEGPLRSLGTRGCDLATGPRMGGPALPGPMDAKEHLERRGYVETVPFGEERRLPLSIQAAELAEGCGIVAAVSSPGGSVTLTEVGGHGTHPCDHGVVLTPVCGDQQVDVQGHGEARIAVFTMPGITADAALPDDLVLAHAEAVHLLGAAGWSPLPEAMKASVTGGRLDDLPEHPSGGCVVYVVAGLGMGHAYTSWIGRPVRNERAQDRFLAGAVVCEHGRRTEVTGSVEPGATPVLVARPYRVEGGPTLPSARSAVPLDLLAAGDRLPMPPSLDDRGAP